MTDDEIIAAVKVDNTISTSAYNLRLSQMLADAKISIPAEGVKNFDPSANPDDAQLAIMYVDWIWQTRNTPDKSEKPRSLKLKLNNRIFGDCMGEAT